MGAEASRSDAAAGPPQSLRRLTSYRKRSSRSWKNRQLCTQLFAVVRHTERADNWGATVNNESWVQTDDFKEWGPIDPPLSDDGIVAAGEIGQRLRACAEACSSEIHVVVSSPYLRCVQTAVEICRHLGPGVRMLLDSSLGEIYGPCVMGADEPTGPTRSMQSLLELCRSHGVVCPPKSLGLKPSWPEDLGAARRRLASRFLQYIHRGTKAQRNFVLVTHADCIGAALRLMPSHADQVVQTADFGAMFLAKRRSVAQGAHGPESPQLGGAGEAEPAAMAAADATAAAVVESLGVEGSSDAGEPLPPPVPEGWSVQTFDLTLHRKKHKSFRQHLRALGLQSDLSEEEMLQLLGELADTPLSCNIPGAGGSSKEPTSPTPGSMEPGARADGGLTRFGSVISMSTYIFGASDLGSDGVCSRSETPAPNAVANFDDEQQGEPVTRTVSDKRRYRIYAQSLSGGAESISEIGGGGVDAPARRSAHADAEPASGKPCKAPAQPPAAEKRILPQIQFTGLSRSTLLQRRAAKGLSWRTANHHEPAVEAT